MIEESPTAVAVLDWRGLEALHVAETPMPLFISSDAHAYFRHFLLATPV